MTRALLLVVAAPLVVVACSTPDAPRATSTPAPVVPAADATPVAVHIQVPDPAEPAVAAWAQELTAAIASGQGNLVLASTPEEAAATVRIDAVEVGAEVSPEPDGEGEISVMRGALAVGESAREFNLVYRGDARPQAEALARNLRRFATEGGTVSAAAAPAETEETGAEPEDES
jgi:hypothetical protein